MILWWLMACVPGRDCLLVRHDGADLSVCMEGPEDSDVVLVHLPGGPSSVGGWLYSRVGVRQELLQEVRVAAMDYRSMGSSKGHFSNDLVTVEQLGRDANEVVGVMQALHPNAEVWLHGHSFGGAVGTAALVEASVADGLVSEAGCFDDHHNAPFSRQRMLDHEPAGDSETLSAWAELQADVAALDPDSRDDQIRLNQWANVADDLLGIETVDNATQSTLGWVAGMPFQYASVAGPGGHAGGLLTEREVGWLDRVSEMDVPALYVTGELDFICTTAHARAAVEAQGPRAELVEFPSVNHQVGDVVPVELATTMLDFIRSR